MAHGEAVPGLEQRIEAWMAEHRIPGAAVGVIVNGQEQVITSGVTSLENPLPVTEDTLFQIGSITKTVTATALMRLWEQGKVELEAPVRRYVPELRLQDPDALERVTVQDLLTHTSGWLGDHLLDTGDGDDALARYVDSLKGIPQLAPAGSVWAYNNAAVALAGRVIEKVAGTTYEAAVRDLVLRPLGMTLSCFFPKEAMLRRFVVGHVPMEDDRTVIADPWPMPRSANPVGGLVSTIRELLRYARFHLGDGRSEQGEQVLREATLRRMQSHVVDGADGQSMGLGWMLSDVDGVRFVTHTGATNGQIAALWLAPDRGAALAVLTNSETGTAFHQAVTAWVREHCLGIKPREPELLDVPAEELAAYTGRFRQVATGGHWELRLEDGALMLHHRPGDMSHFTQTPPPPPPPMRVGVYARDRLLILDGPYKGFRAEFLRDAGGSVAWLRLGGRVHPPVRE